MAIMKLFRNIKRKMNLSDKEYEDSVNLETGNVDISNSNNNGNGNNNHITHKFKSAVKSINKKVILDSITKLDPRYLAKNNPVMFTVEIGFIIVLLIAFLPSNISIEFVNQSRVLYFQTAIILILTVWFATFSESLSEAQLEQGWILFVASKKKYQHTRL